MKQFYQITGKRKSAIARMFCQLNQKKTGKMVIETRNSKNQKTLKTPEEYFFNPELINLINKPIKLTRTAGNYDIIVRLNGGGLSGQAGAVGYAVARFLAMISNEYRLILKQAKLLTRDARCKERKKYGLKKARKAPQFSKR